MKICLVTTFPPSQGGLSEYGFHIARELQRNPFLSLTILADQMPSGDPELEGFNVQRCWRFNDPASSARLLRELLRYKPDVVWFNLLFSTFGRNPLIAFSGLMTPLLARLSGIYTHVTLHHLMDTVDLNDAGVRFKRTYKIAGSLATRLLLLSNSVSVLMPGYRRILNQKYGSDNVHVRSHGILTRRPEFPDFARRGNPEHRILAFGKWGTYKRLELMLDAFAIVEKKLPQARMVVAGGDHPSARGYVDSVRKRCAGNPRIEFTGYVQEEDLGDLFQASTAAVMPYTSSTGCSGVAHLACGYGVPIVCADLEDFQQMAANEELAVEFYRSGDAQALADCLVTLLQNPQKQRELAILNFAAALRMTMPNVVQKYLRHFELQQRTEALRYVTKFRRLPDWVPSKSLLLRTITRSSLGWAQRSALPPVGVRPDSGLRNGNGDGRGDLDRIGASADGYRVSVIRRAPAGNGNQGHPQHETNQAEDVSPALLSRVPTATHEDDATDPERKQQAGIQAAPVPAPPIHPRDGNG
ncbi:MAG TPA: glycosyltransferase [Candidatus Sulfotelmatobacter sp.]|nr:glycosyltransferase [Candidatus Sulfotelmatobacter sp.]